MVMNVPNIEELLSKNIIYIYNEIFRNNFFIDNMLIIDCFYNDIR